MILQSYIHQLQTKHIWTSIVELEKKLFTYNEGINSKSDINNAFRKGSRALNKGNKQSVKGIKANKWCLSQNGEKSYRPTLVEKAWIVPGTR